MNFERLHLHLHFQFTGLSSPRKICHLFAFLLSSRTEWVNTLVNDHDSTPAGVQLLTDEPTATGTLEVEQKSKSSSRKSTKRSGEKKDKR